MQHHILIWKKELEPYNTIIIDTVETCLDYIRMYIEDKDYKLKTNQLKMYGKLKDEFYGFLNRIKNLGKNVVLIAHATTEEQNGLTKTTPKITGGSRDIVRQKSDFIGYMFMNNNKRTLNFNPTDYYEGKNSAGFKVMELPDYKEEPNFFQSKLEIMRNALMESSKEQDDALEIIGKYTAKIHSGKTPEDFHELMRDMANLQPALKLQIWKKLKEYALSIGLLYEASEKKFIKKIEEPAEHKENHVPDFSFE